MKKILFVAGIVALLTVGRGLKAETYNIPEGPGGALASSDYAGVAYSTGITVTTSSVLAFQGPGSIVGFIASSNTSSADFIQFFDTATIVNVGEAFRSADEICRVHLDTNTVTGLMLSGSNKLGSIVKFPAPIRVKRGLMTKVNSASPINVITILYNKFRVN